MNLRQMYRWVKVESKRWAGVNRHFRENVAHFVRGVVHSQSSQVRKIAGYVGGKANSQRRRLQRFIAQRTSVEAFWEGWAQTVARQLKHKVLVLVVDETKLTDQYGVMVIGAVYEGRCIPLIWRVYAGNDADAYPAEGQTQMIITMLTQLKQALPTTQRVRLLADRGIGTSAALMRAVDTLRWQFVFRITCQSKIVLEDGTAVTPYQQVNAPGDAYRADGLIFKKRGRMPGHIRVVWGETAQAPWVIATNDPSITGFEYAQRFWIEEAFRDLKSAGWRLEGVTQLHPERLHRLLVILIVAYAWMLLWGKALEEKRLTASLRSNGVRRYSLFREGRQAFILHEFS